MKGRYWKKNISKKLNFFQKRKISHLGQNHTVSEWRTDHLRHIHRCGFIWKTLLYTPVRKFNFNRGSWKRWMHLFMGKIHSKRVEKIKKTHSKRVEKIKKLTRNEWRRLENTLETSVITFSHLVIFFQKFVKRVVPFFYKTSTTPWYHCKITLKFIEGIYQGTFALICECTLAVGH